MPTIKSKMCSRCKEMKAISEFPKRIAENRKGEFCFECAYEANEKKKMNKPSRPMRNKRST